MKKSLMRVLALTACFALTPCLATRPALGEEPPGWAFSLGSFDLAETRSVEAGIEYRLRPIRIAKAEFTPAVGLSGNSDSGFWAYGGIRYDWEVSERWIITPHFGASLYEEGDGKDLGGPFNFRSGVEISYRLANGRRVGLLFYHLSHARIYDDNPGSNSALLTYSFGR